MECGVSRKVLWSRAGILAASISDHDARHAAVQRTSGIGAAETEESVTLRKVRKRKGWDSQRSFTPDNITLGAMGIRVKLYNTGVEESTLPACDNVRWSGWGV